MAGACRAFTAVPVEANEAQGPELVLRKHTSVVPVQVKPVAATLAVQEILRGGGGCLEGFVTEAVCALWLAMVALVRPMHEALNRARLYAQLASSMPHGGRPARRVAAACAQGAGKLAHMRLTGILCRLTRGRSRGWPAAGCRQSVLPRHCWQLSPVQSGGKCKEVHMCACVPACLPTCVRVPA